MTPHAIDAQNDVPVRISCILGVRSQRSARTRKSYESNAPADRNCHLTYEVAGGQGSRDVGFYVQFVRFRRFQSKIQIRNQAERYVSFEESVPVDH